MKWATVKSALRRFLKFIGDLAEASSREDRQ
jgi:hypothetical protein